MIFACKLSDDFKVLSIHAELVEQPRGGARIVKRVY